MWVAWFIRFTALGSICKQSGIDFWWRAIRVAEQEPISIRWWRRHSHRHSFYSGIPRIPTIPRNHDGVADLCSGLRLYDHYGLVGVSGTLDGFTDVWYRLLIPYSSIATKQEFREQTE